ncbi:hypothetical protein ACOMICROBIO_LKFPLAJE_05109 [Vibrio sp. B1FIG11]|uniref:hypothetical protein n=1 Tax=Vibrio sp. B1FIG11 TaxID=2751177 RepID=UPI0015F62DDE|nr:hypothetical protein [Vibrio sp. B1FIG11]CAE6962156.1 hypothetical protein ACOMICROBIO_LKFPLAJE_05109 [Vibrio sp. B1FIG11]
MKSNRSKIIALSSAVVFALKFENTLGLLPILVAIVAFFTCVIHTSMHLSGVTNADAFGYYQQAQQTKAEALHKGLDPRDKKR